MIVHPMKAVYLYILEMILHIEGVMILRSTNVVKIEVVLKFCVLKLALEMNNGCSLVCINNPKLKLLFLKNVLICILNDINIDKTNVVVIGDLNINILNRNADFEEVIDMYV